MTVSLPPAVPDQVSQDDYSYPSPLVSVVPEIIPIVDDFIVDIRIFDNDLLLESNNFDTEDEEFMALISQIHPTILFSLEGMLEDFDEFDSPLTRSNGH